MKESIQKINEMQEYLQKYFENIVKVNRGYNKKVVFAGMIIKKSVDILSTETHCLKNYIVSVQISLLRLMCDNCLALQSALELGVEEVYDIMYRNGRVSDVMLNDEQNMSDGYLKKQVAKEYKGFDKLYNYACNSIHFSKQALSSSWSKDKDGKIVPITDAGNKEFKAEIISNNDNLLLLCKVIIDMLNRIMKA